jgi:hypothetical protein
MVHLAACARLYFIRKIFDLRSLYSSGVSIRSSCILIPKSHMTLYTAAGYQAGYGLNASTGLWNVSYEVAKRIIHPAYERH